MPWHVEERDGEFCVIKDDDGENEGCHDSEEKAKAQMRALYSSENREEPKLAPIEVRAATLAGVNVEQRIIDIVAVPYEQEAIVEYRGELWHESFERGAFHGINDRLPEDRVPAVRDHNEERLVGRVESFSPDRPEGLRGEVRIGRTALGDETLALAKEKMLAVSAGFAVRGRDQILDRAAQVRRIKRAFIDHVAFVGRGAYAGAEILSVRNPGESTDAAHLPKLDTPRLDEVVAWMESRRLR